MRSTHGLLLACVAGVLITSGCGDGLEYRADQAPSAPPAAQRKAGTQLAYEHTVAIEAEPAIVAARFENTRDACLKDAEFGCTLLNASLTSGDIPHATLVMRIAPKGVPKMLGVASSGGRIARHHTAAEDLAVPVADADRQLQMLTRHRTRLEELQSRRDLNIDQLIKLSQELAQVQTSIEGLTAQRSQLQRRIDTELLTLELSVPIERRAAQETPVRDAVRSFWTTMTHATASAIDTVAAGLPWLLFVGIPLLLLGRFLWRWSGRRVGGK